MNTARSTTEHLLHSPSSLPLAYEAPPDIAPTSQYNSLAPETNELYDDDWIWALAPGLQHTEPVVELENQAPYTIGLSTFHPYPQHNAELVEHSQPTPVEPVDPVTGSMGPPASSRKRKAPTLREADWEPYKKRILDLHVEQNLPLPRVRQMIAEEYGFDAEIRQYRTRISQWEKDKNVKLQEMKAIVRKNQTRKLVETNKAPLVFEVRGNQVGPQKIERWMKRHEVASNSLYAPSPEAPTPSAVGCYTISERGSPALMSVHSPAASRFSSEGAYLMAQSPQMPSPALSVSSIVRPQQSTFVGQSPSPTYRSLTNSGSNDAPFSTILQSESINGIQTRYREDEENVLRARLHTAQNTPGFSLAERLEIFHKLISLLICQGRYRAAEDTTRKLLECFEGHSGVGDDEAGKLRALNSLGRVLAYQGNYDKGERLLRRVLQRIETVLGPDHLDTFHTASSLGTLLYIQGKYDEAEAMHRLVLNGRKAVLGPDDLGTFISNDNLGLVLTAQGKYEEAEEMHRWALQGFDKILGRNSHEALIIVYNLVIVLEKQGNFNEAKTMLGFQLEGSKTILGPNHPLTLRNMVALGTLLAVESRYDDAKEMLELALEGSETVLGRDHPNTLQCFSRLANLFHQQRDYKTALEYYERAYSGCVTKLGGLHPATVTCREQRDFALQEKCLF